jgi:hypothetical protein
MWDRKGNFMKALPPLVMEKENANTGYDHCG